MLNNEKRQIVITQRLLRYSKNIFRSVLAMFLVMALLLTMPYFPFNYGIAEASSTQHLWNLEIGDRVVDNSWQWEYRTGVNYTGYGVTKPVVWIVVAKNHYGAGSGVTLLSEELIGAYCFDNSTNRGSEFGSNHWGSSGTPNASHGLRPWLNSTGIHSKEGFYDAFSSSFKSSIVTVSLPNKEWRYGNTYTTNDKVFIPSNTELGDTEHFWTYQIGSTYDYFSGVSSSDRKARLGTTFWNYWTRSPYSDHLAPYPIENPIDTPYMVCYVEDSGKFGGVYASHPSEGVRPALNLRFDTQVSETPNAAGIYEIMGSAPPQDTGYIIINIEPASARDAGAQWKLTSGPDQGWKNSGEATAALPAGTTYTVTFRDIPGWTKPEDKTVTVVADVCYVGTGTYLEKSFDEIPYDQNVKVPTNIIVYNPSTKSDMHLEFEHYIMGVVQKELSPGFIQGILSNVYSDHWNDFSQGKIFEALKAQALVSRTFAAGAVWGFWRQGKDIPIIPSTSNASLIVGEYDQDWEAPQYNIYPNTKGYQPLIFNAVTSTKSHVLSYVGNYSNATRNGVIDAFFSSYYPDGNGLTIAYWHFQPYGVPVNCYTHPRNYNISLGYQPPHPIGHGRGMSQWGTVNMATGIKLNNELQYYNYQEILEHYFKDAYIVKALPTSNSQTYKLNSPGSLRVYDSDGNVTGLVNGDIQNEIPSSFYNPDTKEISIDLPFDTYRVEVHGNEYGAYDLSMLSYNSGYTSNLFLKNVQIIPRSLHQYQIDWDIISTGGKGIFINIDGMIHNTSLPIIPSNPKPADHSFDTSRNTILSWLGGDNIDLEKQIYYEVYFGTDINPPQKEVLGPFLAEKDNIRFNPGLLEMGTKYYWRVLARDQFGFTVEGPLWQFTTGNHLDANLEIDPETIQLGAQGRWITAYIKINGFELNEEDVQPIQLLYNDYSISAHSGEVQNDGQLMVKFDWNTVAEWFNIETGFEQFEELTVTGEVDGIPFVGKATVRVISPQARGRNR